MLVAPQITGDTMSITASITLHSVKKISAHSPSTLGAPLILSLTGHEFPTCGSITIFLQDQELVDRLVGAINKASEMPTLQDVAAEDAEIAAREAETRLYDDDKYDYAADDMAFDAAREARMFKR
jgi:hypothetical protein